MAIFHEVATLVDPLASEPFALIRIDTDKPVGKGVEGVVVSLHRTRDEAEEAAALVDLQVPALSRTSTGG